MNLIGGKKRDMPWPYKPTSYQKNKSKKEKKEKILEQKNSKEETEMQVEAPDTGEPQTFEETGNEKAQLTTKTKTENEKQNLPKHTVEVEKVEEVASENEKLLKEAIKLHDAGAAGDKDAVVKAHDVLKKLRKLKPENKLIEGYYGSVKTLLGRDAINPTERFNKALEGLKILDKVIKDNRENIQLRILRANVCYRLPEMYFHRTDTAIEDFNFLISRYEQDNTIITEDFYWQLLYDLGGAYKTLNKTQEAKETWLKLANITTDSKYAKLLKQEGIQLPKKKTQVEDFPPVQKEEIKVSQDEDEETNERVEEVHLSEEKVELLEKPPAPENIETDVEPPTVNNPSLIEEGIELHALALSGDKEATRKAYDYFNKAHKTYPEDDLITAYYADCLSMTGRDSTIPTNMFGNAIKAMKLLDEVVNKNPNNIQVRYLRAYQSFRLPEGFFRRTATAIGDFEYLIKCYEEGSDLITRDTYWQLLYDLGVAYQCLGMDQEAEVVWDKLLSQTPYDKYHELIDQHLDSSLKDIEARVASLGSKEELLKEGIRLHDLGVAGNKKAVKMAHEILEKIHESDPENAEAMAYYGSSVALTGRDALDASIMFGNAIEGLKLLKQAIKRDPGNPQFRLLRAYVFNSLPQSFFPLKEKAIKDFKYVKNAYEQGNSNISQEMYWQVLYELGAAYRESGNDKKAQKTWEKLLAESTDPKYRELIDIEIKE
ncbi:MAG: hypothetical protein PWQ67_1128 [Clostridia bacterium]|nr:hypothetical protein [Clostridia bacterium]MDN5322674.1 hypothetical protein [Clostridia bacterium]